MLLATVGILSNQTTIGVLGLSLLLWFQIEWALFSLRVHFGLRHLSIKRRICDERGPVDTLWMGRVFRVEVGIKLDGRLSLPHLALADRLPFAVELAEGITYHDGPMSPGRDVQLHYQVRCPHLGRVRFEGVRVQAADLQGFFYHATFLHDAFTCRVLPVLVDSGGQPATTKRHNLLPVNHRRPTLRLTTVILSR